VILVSLRGEASKSLNDSNVPTRDTLFDNIAYYPSILLAIPRCTRIEL